MVAIAIVARTGKIDESHGNGPTGRVSTSAALTGGRARSTARSRNGPSVAENVPVRCVLSRSTSAPPITG
jgi:hypothetical protein